MFITTQFDANCNVCKATVLLIGDPCGIWPKLWGRQAPIVSFPHTSSFPTNLKEL